MCSSYVSQLLKEMHAVASPACPPLTPRSMSEHRASMSQNAFATGWKNSRVPTPSQSSLAHCLRALGPRWRAHIAHRPGKSMLLGPLPGSLAP